METTNDNRHIEILRKMVGSIEVPTATGRPVSAFTIDHSTKVHHRATREAYIRRLHHFKILTALDLDTPGIDPIGEVSGKIGTCRRTLWLYMHHCLPEHPAKKEELRSLLDLHNANLLMQGIEKSILGKLAAGEITDAGYAAMVLDETNFITFAREWFDRPKGNRAL